MGLFDSTWHLKNDTLVRQGTGFAVPCPRGLLRCVPPGASDLDTVMDALGFAHVPGESSTSVLVFHDRHARRCKDSICIGLSHPVGTIPWEAVRRVVDHWERGPMDGILWEG